MNRMEINGQLEIPGKERDEEYNIHEKILEGIMDLEEFEEFYERLEELGKGHNIEVLYTNQQVIFYFK